LESYKSTLDRHAELGSDMVKALVLMTLVGGTGERLEWSKETKDQLKQIAGVDEVYGVFGRYDLVAMVEAETWEKLTILVTDKIRSVPGVQTSETLTIVF